MVKQFDGDGCLYHATAKWRGEVAEEQHIAVTKWSDMLTAKVAPIERQASSIPERTRSGLREGVAAFVTGAGLSMSCGLPSWQQLVTDVFRQMLATREYEKEEIESTLGAVKFADDLLAMAQTLTSILDEDGVASLVASRLYSCRPQRSPLLEALGEVIENSLKHYVKKQRPFVILTFNYDTLLEEELGRRGIAVESLDRAVTLPQLKPSTVSVIHAHGIVGKTEARGKIVFTEQSYGDAYLKKADSDPLTGMLKASLCPIFIGFSFRDNFVRQILQRFLIEKRNPAAVAIMAGPDLVDSTNIAVSSRRLRSFTPNDEVGWRKTGKNPVKARQSTLAKLPEHLARWMLYSIGVEWWRVSDRAALAGGLKKLIGNG